MKNHKKEMAENVFYFLALVLMLVVFFGTYNLPFWGF